jgi:CubicO group peptidase (beta-lactamase class C family)
MKPLRACRVLLTCIFCVAEPAWPSDLARSAPPFDLRAVDAHLQMQVAAKHLPGLAVAIVEGDRVVTARGYGSAGGGRPVTPQTQFYIGSCTKSFTALAVMQLVERGQLELDAPVRRYLPWFRVADDTASARITVRHLLNQTSGLSEAGDPEPHRRSPSLIEGVRALRQVRLTAPVGARFQYYNPNYRVLGVLIEQASGQTYSAYLRDHVLAPLAMFRTVAEPTAAPDLAQGHAQVFGFSFPRPQAFDPGALSSGFLISTAEDVSHYLVALLNDGRYGNTSIVQPTTVAQLFAPPDGVDGTQAAPPAAVTRLLGSPNGIESGYAMGWLVARPPAGVRMVFHGGSLERFQAEMLLLPEEKRGFVTLVNRNGVLQPLLDPSPPWMGLAHLMLGRAGPPPPPTRRRVWLFAGVVAADLGIGLWRIGRLRLWRRKAARRSGRARWSRALIDVGIPGAFLVGFPKLLGLAVRTDVTWPGFFDFLPDVAVWFMASAGLSLARGAAKVVILAGSARTAAGAPTGTSERAR